MVRDELLLWNAKRAEQSGAEKRLKARERDLQWALLGLEPQLEAYDASAKEKYEQLLQASDESDGNEYVARVCILSVVRPPRTAAT